MDGLNLDPVDSNCRWIGINHTGDEEVFFLVDG